VRPQDERLRGALHDEAERYFPDHEAMLARIDERRGRERHGIWSALVHPVGPVARRTMAVVRPVAAAFAVAGVLVAGITGMNVANRSTDGGVATEPADSVPTTRSSGDYLRAAAVRDPHSIPSWTQGNLTLTTTEEITALDVTIRIARTPGVADTGHWSSIPVEMMTSNLTSTDGELIYRFTLNPGGRLAPGSYVFAAQFNHSTDPRPSTDDSYEATTTASGTAHVAGPFTS
jgi:hypothetical protein